MGSACAKKMCKDRDGMFSDTCTCPYFNVAFFEGSFYCTKCMVFPFRCVCDCSCLCRNCTHYRAIRFDKFHADCFK